MFNIAEELKKLPDQPGVYIMHDSHDASSISVRLSVYEREYTSISSRVMMRASKRHRW